MQDARIPVAAGEVDPFAALTLAREVAAGQKNWALVAALTAAIEATPAPVARVLRIVPKRSP